MIRKPLQTLGDLEEALSGAGLDSREFAGLLTRVRAFLQRYAELERTLLEGIRVTVPRHLLDGFAEDEEGPDPTAPVEGLARRERERLGFGGVAGRDVMTLLDRDQLKVYRPVFSEGSALRGIFLFDETIGPAFVADGRLPHSASNAVFARLYGHYLLDHDPYEIRCVVAGDAGRDARALRAQHFAVAFLIGREEFLGYLDAAGWRPGDPLDPLLQRQLTVFFEADPVTVMSRFLSLGLADSGDFTGLLGPEPEEGTAPPAETGPVPGEEAAIPDRFVRLALEAHARGRLTLKQLTAYLETDLGSARRLAAQFDTGSLDSGSPES